MAADPDPPTTVRHERMCDMAEATPTTTPKAKTKPATDMPKFEMPSFEMPKFEIPSFEVPAAFREFAEKGVNQAKANWEKVKAATEETTDMLEDSYSTATKGCSDYGLKMIEMGRANANATFDFASQMMTVKSLSEAIELSTAFTRKQFEALGAQSKDLTALAQKITTETCEPIKESVATAFKKVA
jgi:phasin